MHITALQCWQFLKQRVTCPPVPVPGHPRGWAMGTVHPQLGWGGAGHELSPSCSVVGFSFFFIIFLSSFPPSNGVKLIPGWSPWVRSSQSHCIRMVLGMSLGGDSSGLALSLLKFQQGNGETEAGAAPTSPLGV